MTTTPTSKYLHKFNRAAVDAKDGFTLPGDFLIVEEIKDEEFSKAITRADGSTVNLIVDSGSKRNTLSLDADRPCFARVLLAGQGYYNDETLEDVPLDVVAGDIILVGRHSLKKFSVFGRLMSYGDTQLALARAEEVQMRFHGQEGFDQFFDVLNATA